MKITVLALNLKLQTRYLEMYVEYTYLSFGKLKSGLNGDLQKLVTQDIENGNFSRFFIERKYSVIRNTQKYSIEIVPLKPLIKGVGKKQEYKPIARITSAPIETKRRKH
jgi:hypothetical protein